MFKGRSIPLSFFHPIGNPVAFLGQPKLTNSKLDPPGEKGRLLGYNPELLSFQILADNGKIVDTKNVWFLDFCPPSPINSSTSDEFYPSVKTVSPESNIGIEPSPNSSHRTTPEPLDSSSAESKALSLNEPVANTAPITSCNRALRDRTPNIKPAKYSHHSCADPDSVILAKRTKLLNIEDHQVWDDYYETPEKALRTTWAIRDKPATFSAPAKTKARLCIQGFLQEPGVDFHKTFAPTGKFPSLLLLLVLAMEKGLPVRQFNVKSAFLYAPLKEDIFIKTPAKSHRSAPYLKLKKSLYGLRQAPLNWHETLTSWLLSLGYQQSDSDACVFYNKITPSYLYLHVDDLVVAGDVDAFQTAFLERFPESAAHKPDTLLGMDIKIDKFRCLLNQSKLIKKGLEMLHLENCRLVLTPLTPNVSLTPLMMRMLELLLS